MSSRPEERSMFHMPIKNDKYLETLFVYFNAKFFNNEIKIPDKIKFKKNLKAGKDKCDGLFREKNGKTEIYLDEGMKQFPAYCQITLLHEMTHAATKCESEISHNYRFGAEIVRLFNNGAYDDLI